MPEKAFGNETRLGVEDGMSLHRHIIGTSDEDRRFVMEAGRLLSTGSKHNRRRSLKQRGKKKSRKGWEE